MILRRDDDAGAVGLPCELAGFGPDAIRGREAIHQRERRFDFGQLPGIAHAAQHFQHDHAAGEEFPIFPGGCQFRKGVPPGLGDD